MRTLSSAADAPKGVDVDFLGGLTLFNRIEFNEEYLMNPIKQIFRIIALSTILWGPPTMLNATVTASIDPSPAHATPRGPNESYTTPQVDRRILSDEQTDTIQDGNLQIAQEPPNLLCLLVPIPMLCGG